MPKHVRTRILEIGKWNNTFLTTGPNSIISAQGCMLFLTSHVTISLKDCKNSVDQTGSSTCIDLKITLYNSLDIQHIIILVINLLLVRNATSFNSSVASFSST